MFSFLPDPPLLHPSMPKKVNDYIEFSAKLKQPASKCPSHTPSPRRSTALLSPGISDPGATTVQLQLQKVHIGFWVLVEDLREEVLRSWWKLSSSCCISHLPALPLFLLGSNFGSTIYK